MLNNLDTLFYTLAFLVPGFIIHSIIGKFIHKKPEDEKQTVFLYLTYSCFNYAVWSWLFYLMPRTDYFQKHITTTAIIWFCIIFISPIVLGITFGQMSKQRKGIRLLKWMRLDPIDEHPYPSAWDALMGNIHESWVLVTLKDNSSIIGWLGSNSHIGGLTRDLYIQEIAEQDANGKICIVPRSGGIWIEAEQIKHIQLFNYPKDLEESDVRQESTDNSAGVNGQLSTTPTSAGELSTKANEYSDRTETTGQLPTETSEYSDRTESAAIPESGTVGDSTANGRNTAKDKISSYPAASKLVG